MSVFEKIGIYGMKSDQEDALLACLLTGDPALLIGKQGTAKTGLVLALGTAMRESTRRSHPDSPDAWYKCHAYDASKINFEDLIGFPNVEALKEGKVDFTRSPMTVWDKDLVSFDEFNRQLPERQNNIFELVRSRTCMGMPTDVKWVINCMNPFGMAGTEELDEALVDRHQWFIYVNDFHSLGDKDKVSVVQHVGHHDAPALKRVWQQTERDFDVTDDGSINERLADAGDMIIQIMHEASAQYSALEAGVGDAYAVFVARFLNTLNHDQQGKDWKVDLSGRRGGMVHRGLLAFRAVQLAKAKVLPRYDLCDLKTSFKHVMRMTIPAGIAQATSTGPSQEAVASISNAVETFSDFFVATGSLSMVAAIDTMYELITTKSLARKVDLLLHELVDDASKNQIWSGILADNPNATAPEKVRRDVLINIVAHLMTVQPEIVPTNFRKPLATAANETQGMRTLYKSFEIGQGMVFFGPEIEEHLKSIDNSFVKLQAKIIYEDEAAKNTNPSRQEFFEIKQRAKSECDQLMDVLRRDNIPDIEDVTSTDEVPDTDDGASTDDIAAEREAAKVVANVDDII